MTLRKKIYETVHRSKLSVEELADALGCSTSLLYRCSNPNDNASLSVDRLLPIMKACKDFRILKHLANRAGFLLVKMPKGRKPTNGDLSKFQASLARQVGAIYDFWAGEISKEQAISNLLEALEGIAFHKTNIEQSNQPQLPFSRGSHD